MRYTPDEKAQAVRLVRQMRVVVTVGPPSSWSPSDPSGWSRPPRRSGLDRTRTRPPWGRGSVPLPDATACTGGTRARANRGDRGQLRGPFGDVRRALHQMARLAEP